MAKKTEETLAVVETETRSIEAWGEAKGLLPQFSGSIEIAGGLEAPRANPNYWKFAAGKALRGWQDGQLVTEQVFDEAVHIAATQPL